MDVLEYFRLDEEPFRLSPSPRFLYLNDQVKQATAKVEYMTKHRTAPLYMHGGIGSGKTSILRRLYEELSEDDTYTLRLVIARNIKAANCFLRGIMDAFGIPTDRACERSLTRLETVPVEQIQTCTVTILFVG